MTPPLKPFRCKNPACAKIVARTDGVDIYFGSQKVPGNPLRVQFLCDECKRPLEWKKLKDTDLPLAP